MRGSCCLQRKRKSRYICNIYAHAACWPGRAGGHGPCRFPSVSRRLIPLAAELNARRQRHAPESPVSPRGSAANMVCNAQSRCAGMVVANEPMPGPAFSWSASSWSSYMYHLPPSAANVLPACLELPGVLFGDTKLLPPCFELPGVTFGDLRCAPQSNTEPQQIRAADGAKSINRADKAGSSQACMAVAEDWHAGGYAADRNERRVPPGFRAHGACTEGA